MPGSTLRILDEGRFEVVWTDDGWKTTDTDRSRSLGSAGFSADVTPAGSSGELEWTMHWTERNTLAWIQCEGQVETRLQSDSAGALGS